MRTAAHRPLLAFGDYFFFRVFFLVDILLRVIPPAAIAGGLSLGVSPVAPLDRSAPAAAFWPLLRVTFRWFEARCDQWTGQLFEPPLRPWFSRLLVALLQWNCSSAARALMDWRAQGLNPCLPNGPSASGACRSHQT